MWFSDGDLTSGNDWVADVTSGQVSWTAPSGTMLGSNTLDWGSLYSFSITVDREPMTAQAQARIAQAGTPSSQSVQTLVPDGTPPLGDAIFSDGFEVAPDSD